MQGYTTSSVGLPLRDFEPEIAFSYRDDGSSVFGPNAAVHDFIAGDRVRLVRFATLGASSYASLSFTTRYSLQILALTVPGGCSDGIDNDGDGAIDALDPGCTSSGDPSERDAGLPCDDGVDNDGDLLPDHPADPGCASPTSVREDPACQDGLDNDGEGFVDFDGGQSVYGVCLSGSCPPGVSDPDQDGSADPDPQCVDRPWRDREAPSPRCGIGWELALLLPAMRTLRRRASH